MKFFEVQLYVDRFVRARAGALRRIDFVVGVSRGGLIPAALIAARLDKPLVAVYIDRQDRVYLDRKDWIREKRVLVVDDIVRTGATLSKMLALVKKAGVRDVKSFTLFCVAAARIRPTWTKITPRDKKMPWDFSYA